MKYFIQNLNFKPLPVFYPSMRIVIKPSVNWPNPQNTVDLVTFTEQIITGKLHF